MDETLARQLADDLATSFATLVRRDQDRVFGLAFRLTARRADAEDVAQKAFIRAYRALRSYSPDRVRALDLRPWLFRIVVNVARNHARARPRVEHLDLADAPGTPDEPSHRPEAAALRHETVRELVAALDTLPMRMREAVVLRHVHGLDYLELSRVLGRPIGTVKSDVHRGTRLLRAYLAAHPTALPTTRPQEIAP